MNSNANCCVLFAVNKHIIIEKRIHVDERKGSDDDAELANGGGCKEVEGKQNSAEINGVKKCLTHQILYLLVEYQSSTHIVQGNHFCYAIIDSISSHSFAFVGKWCTEKNYRAREKRHFNEINRTNRLLFIE